MRFTYTTDHEDGLDGLLPEGSPPSFAPLGAMGAIHDMVEHEPHNPEYGTLHDEMRAFGVVYWGRGAGDYWHRRRPTSRYQEYSENVHYEIYKFLAEWVGGVTDTDFEECPKPWPEICPDAADIFDETVDKVREDVLAGEFTYLILRDDGCEGDNPDDNKAALDALEPHLEEVRGWLRVGFASAVERFNDMCPYQFVGMWCELEDKIEECLKGYNVPAGELFGGETLIVTWSDSTGETSAEWEDTNYYDYEDEDDEDDDDDDDEED